MGTAKNSLGFDKPPRETRVVAAMSGGVDSSAVAGLLAREGYDVVGVTLQLYDHGSAVARKGACCAGKDIHDARRVAEMLGIKHYVLDYEDKFRRAVIEGFADSYARGETPVPCVLCNEKIKFGDLLTLARELQADALATGHYVRRVEGPGGAELHRAADTARDQSYFLFATTPEQLAMLRFPLGGAEKAAVRETARSLGLPVAEKPDSQDICFVPNGRYAQVVEKLRPAAAAPGEIVDLSGRVIGQHPGIMHFTVGQRKGLHLSGNAEPLFVVRIEPRTRRIVVGPKESLRSRTISLQRVNWLGDSRKIGAVKVRSMRPPVPARVEARPGGEAEVWLPGGEDSIAPGQACVFYEADGTRMLGGGWIKRSEPAEQVA